MVSLLTILFAFSAIAGERETGTLKLMLSNSVSRGQLLLGKFLGGYGSLVASFPAAALIAILLAALSPSVALGSEGLLRIALMILVSLVYIAVFFFIGIAVSTLTRRSSTAVLLLLAIWIVLALVVPNVGWLVAKQVVVVPSEQQIDEDEVKYHSSMKQNQVRIADELERAFSAAFSGEFRKSPPPRDDPHAYHAWRVNGGGRGALYQRQAG